MTKRKLQRLLDFMDKEKKQHLSKFSHDDKEARLEAIASWNALNRVQREIDKFREV